MRVDAGVFTELSNNALVLLKNSNAVLWGPPITTLLLGIGIYYTIRLNFITWRNIPRGFVEIWRGRKTCKGSKGELSPFNALMTALAATIGTGNIVGVATAVFAGGPGALFWMWVTGIVGVTTKFAECVLAVHYREKTADGSYVGGPMYYIKNGLGAKWKPVAAFFAIATAFASLGTGNAVQTNAIAHALQSSYGISPGITAVVLFVLIGIVVLGGVKYIGSVAGKLVPFMALLYITASLIVLFLNFEKIPGVFALVFKAAFSTQAAVGGFLGASVQMAMRYGLARGVFANEAGLGSSPIAHAAAITKSPVHQGMIAMMGTIMDTMFVCTLTGLIILITGAWSSGESGSTLTGTAFQSALGSIGMHVVPVCLTLFAATTILGWCVYGERSIRYLFGDKFAFLFRLVFMAVIPVGAIISKSELVWEFADFFNGLMIIPNVVGLLLLSPVVVRLVKEYQKEEAECQRKNKQ